MGWPAVNSRCSLHSGRAYLNDLYRLRAERAGITYIDVWDGFVDEAGKYSNYGPDYEGQVRRLRVGSSLKRERSNLRVTSSTNYADS